MMNFKDCIECIKVIKRHLAWSSDTSYIETIIPEGYELTPIVRIQKDTLGRIYKKTMFSKQMPLIYVIKPEETKTTFVNMSLNCCKDDTLEQVQEVIVKELVRMLIEKTELPDSKASRMFLKSLFKESSLIDLGKSHKEDLERLTNIDGTLEEVIDRFTEAICMTINRKRNFYLKDLKIK